jgi:hypothetical protein
MDDEKKQEIVNLIFSYGGHPSPKAKQWVLNQILAILLDNTEYNEFLITYAEGENGPFTYNWSKGQEPCQI